MDLCLCVRVPLCMCMCVFIYVSMRLIFTLSQLFVNFFSGHQDDLIPYFLDLACDKFALVGPLLELSKTSDLSSPVAW